MNPNDLDNVQQFADRVKAQYPDYANIDPYELVARITSRYPEYQSRISSFNVSGAEKLSGVSPSMLRHYLNLYDQFQQAGITPTVKAGFRTAEQENALYKAGYPTKGNDGYNKISPHQEGRALDLSFSNEQKAKGRQIMAQYAQANGLHIPSDEPWHIAVLKSGRELFNIEASPDEPPQQPGRVPEPPTTLTHKSSGRFELTPQEKARIAGKVELPKTGGVPTMADVLNEAKSTPYTPTTRDQISKQVNAEESSLVGNLKHGFDLFSRPQDVLKSREQIINEEIDRRVAAHERSGTPEMITARKRIGSVPGEVPLVPGMPSPRGAAAALQGFAGSLLQSLAGVVNMGGYSPSIKARMMGDYLQRSGQILEESASMPLNEQGQEIERNLPEKATSAVTSLGLTVAQLALLKKATGWSLGRIMAVETALRTSDMPAADRTVEIAKAYGMGRILDQHLSRPASAALFGGPTAIQTGTAYLQGKMTLADALLETGVQAGAGAIMGGKRGVPEKPATQIDAMPDVSNIPVSKIPPAEVIAPQSASEVQIPSVEPTPAALPLKPLTTLAVGRESPVSTERGTEVSTKYAIAEAADLVTSHDTMLNKNPDFPDELQPRQRDRAASAEQIDRIAKNPRGERLGESPMADTGAPIVGPDGIVESGNGRVLGLRKAFESGKADNYRQYLLDNAEAFGLDRAAIEAATEPVLVRIRQTEVDRPQFVREANESGVASMSAPEQARSDAQRLSGSLLSSFAPSESGEINTAANTPFIQGFMRDVVGPNELGRYVSAKGEISQEGLTRIRNAIFARAYGDSPEGLRALEKIAESPDNNVRNITTALLQRAGQFASLKEGIAKGERHQLDPTNDLTKALAKMSSLREQDQTVADYLNQRGLFGEDLTPMQKQMLWAFDEFKRSPKAISSILDNYAKGAEAAGSPKQTAFFEKSPPTKDALLEAAIRETVRDANKEIGLFTSEGVPAEPEASRGVPNIDQASKPVSEGVPRPDRSIEVGRPGEANEGIAQNLGPGAANINEPFPEVKERSFGKQLMADERLVEDLKESLGTSRYYEPVPNNLTAENAREFVDSRGVPEAMKAIRDESNGMPFHVRSTAGQVVILRLNEAITNLKDINPEGARFALDQATEMSEWAMDYGTRLGQGVQSFAMWAKLLPEGKLLTFKRAVEKARAEHKAAVNGEVEEILETVNQEGLTHEERVAELTKLFGKNKTARSVKSDLDKLVSAAEDGKLTDQKFYEITAERLGLPKYTPEIANRIVGLANAIKDAPEGIPKDRAIFALNKFIAEQKGFGPEDIPYGIYYGNILSGYNTHIVNTVDTALNVISEINGLAMNDPRAAAKIYTGLLRGLNEGRLDALMVLTEGRMVTDGKWLEVPRLMEIAQFGKEGGVPIRTNTRTARATKAITESKIAYPLNAYKYVTRMLAASDSVFFRSAKEARASLLAYRMAEAEGLKGDAIDTRAREILALDRQSDFLAQAKHEGFTGSEAQTRAIELRDFVRNKDINSDSADFAGEATYNHDPHGLLGMFSSGLSRWSDTFKPLKLFVPFTRIVANVTNRGLNYTPWGYKRAAFGYTLGEGLSPEARRLMITRATVGTAGLVTLGAMQYGGLLQIHGNGPSDSERRRQLMSAGWKPYSIQMGNAYISYLNSPLGLGLSVLGNMTDSQRYHELEQKDAATRGAYAVARIGSTIFSQSFLAGLSRLFEALSNDPSESVNAVKQVMSGTVAAMTTPNLVRDGYKLFDNKQYQSNTFTEDLVRNTPFAALALRPSLNAFGEPVTLPRQRFVDIASNDPAWRFVIARGLRVPVPGRTTELKPGKRVTAEQYYSLLQTTGPQLKQWIAENQLRLSGMTEDAAQKELSKAAEKFHERALDQMEPSRLIMRSVFRGVPRPPEMASPTP